MISKKKKCTPETPEECIKVFRELVSLEKSALDRRVAAAEACARFLANEGNEMTINHLLASVEFEQSLHCTFPEPASASITSVAVLNDITSAAGRLPGLLSSISPSCAPVLSSVLASAVPATLDAHPCPSCGVIQAARRVGVAVPADELFMTCRDPQVLRTLVPMISEGGGSCNGSTIPPLSMMILNERRGWSVTESAMSWVTSSDAVLRREAWGALTRELKKTKKPTEKLKALTPDIVDAAVDVAFTELSAPQPGFMAEAVHILEGIISRDPTRLDSVYKRAVALPANVRGRYAALATIIQAPPIHRVLDPMIAGLIPALHDTSPATSLHVARLMDVTANLADERDADVLVEILRRPGLPSRIVQACLRRPSPILADAVQATLDTLPGPVGVALVRTRPASKWGRVDLDVLKAGTLDCNEDVRHQAMAAAVKAPGPITDGRLAVILDGIISGFTVCGGVSGPRVVSLLQALKARVTPTPPTPLLWGGVGITSWTDIADQLARAALDGLHPLNAVTNQQARVDALRAVQTDATPAIIGSAWATIWASLFSSFDTIRTGLTPLLTLPPLASTLPAPHPTLTIEGRLAAMTGFPEHAEAELFAAVLAQRIVHLASQHIPVSVHRHTAPDIQYAGRDVPVTWTVTPLPPCTTQCDIMESAVEATVDTLLNLVTEARGPAPNLAVQAIPGLVALLGELLRLYTLPSSSSVPAAAFKVLQQTVSAATPFVDSELTRPSDVCDNGEYVGSVLHLKAWRAVRVAHDLIVALSPTLTITDRAAAAHEMAGVLLRVRHAGAIKHTTSSLRRLGVPAAQHRPMLADLLERMNGAELTLRRSSSGLPFLATAILGATDRDTGLWFIDRVVAGVETFVDHGPVHCLNVLNAVLLDARVFLIVQSELERISMACTRALTNTQWRITSAATQLFANAVHRLIGKKFNADDRGDLHQLLTQYPNVAAHSLRSLQHVGQSWEAAFPCLTLLVRLNAPAPDSITDDVRAFGAAIHDAARVVLGHPHHHVRLMAARLVDRYEWSNTSDSQPAAGVEAKVDPNLQHGLSLLHPPQAPTPDPYRLDPTPPTTAAPIDVARRLESGISTDLTDADWLALPLSIRAQTLHTLDVTSDGFAELFVTTLEDMSNNPTQYLPAIIRASRPDAGHPAWSPMMVSRLLTALVFILLRETFESGSVGLDPICCWAARLAGLPLPRPGQLARVTVRCIIRAGYVDLSPQMEVEAVTSENMTVLAHREVMGDGAVQSWVR